MKQIGDLEKPIDLKFQKTQWSLQALGLMGMYAVVVLALLGMLGPALMEVALRAVAIYAILLVVFRLSGKRSMGQITTFDFILLLVIGEAVQQGLTGENYTISGAVVLVLTLVCCDQTLSLLKQQSLFLDRVFDDVPLVILSDGKPIQERMKRERINEHEILAAARKCHGLDRLEDIKTAVLERDGSISVIPRGK